MPALIRITLTDESRRAIQAAIGRSRSVRKVVADAAARAAELVVGQIVKEDLSGKTLNVITGNLRRSLSSRVIRGGNIVAAIGVIKGPAMKYAAIHEFGGTIKPVKGQYLAIPLRAAKSGGGRPRFPGGPREAALKYPDTFVLKRPGKNPLICATLRVKGKGKNAGKVKGILPLFVLVKSVTMPARHWLSEGVRDKRRFFMVEIEKDLNRLLEAK
jgi:hypothetical protein